MQRVSKPSHQHEGLRFPPRPQPSWLWLLPLSTPPLLRLSSRKELPRSTRLSRTPSSESVIMKSHYQINAEIKKKIEAAAGPLQKKLLEKNAAALDKQIEWLQQAKEKLEGKALASRAAINPDSIEAKILSALDKIFKAIDEMKAKIAKITEKIQNAAGPLEEKVLTKVQEGLKKQLQKLNELKEKLQAQLQKA
ncbi:hypothetical protein GE061_002492 [Apolygus lucorum]|uniref:Uncharacterized protein n=1 Tax=Apolygus lucorum TaxID=248454 RepID=A0A8S9X582_APOLU|nr:hypothetical protein GE061_002492 [Apolygus lucorum]